MTLCVESRGVFVDVTGTPGGRGPLLTLDDRPGRPLFEAELPAVRL
jgi:hypothetical protein